MFLDCLSLTEIIIPDSVTEIGCELVLFHNHSLTKLNIANRILTPNDDLFNYIITSGYYKYEFHKFTNCLELHNQINNNIILNRDVIAGEAIPNKAGDKTYYALSDASAGTGFKISKNINGVSLYHGYKYGLAIQGLLRFNWTFLSTDQNFIDSNNQNFRILIINNNQQYKSNEFFWSRTSEFHFEVDVNLTDDNLISDDSIIDITNWQKLIDSQLLLNSLNPCAECSWWTIRGRGYNILDTSKFNKARNHEEGDLNNQEIDYTQYRITINGNPPSDTFKAFLYFENPTLSDQEFNNIYEKAGLQITQDHQKKALPLANLVEFKNYHTSSFKKGIVLIPKRLHSDLLSVVDDIEGASVEKLGLSLNMNDNFYDSINNNLNIYTASDENMYRVSGSPNKLMACGGERIGACKPIIEFTIPNTITEIHGDFFSNTLIEEIIFPSSIESISPTNYIEPRQMNTYYNKKYTTEPLYNSEKYTPEHVKIPIGILSGCQNLKKIVIENFSKINFKGSHRINDWFHGSSGGYSGMAAWMDKYHLNNRNWWYAYERARFQQLPELKGEGWINYIAMMFQTNQLYNINHTNTNIELVIGGLDSFKKAKHLDLIDFNDSNLSEEVPDDIHSEWSTNSTLLLDEYVTPANVFTVQYTGEESLKDDIEDSIVGRTVPPKTAYGYSLEKIDSYSPDGEIKPVTDFKRNGWVKR